MTRLFIAIDLPDAVKEQLADLQLDDIPGTRWVKPIQMHLTLKFLGEVDDATFATVREKLGTVRAAGFDMLLSGVGCFPPLKGKRPPKVIWVGVQQHEALRVLYRGIESAMEAAGFEREQRRFHPHITLGRVKVQPPRGAVEGFLKRNMAFHTDVFPVREFILYSSVLDRSGPTYTREQVYQLGAPA